MRCRVLQKGSRAMRSARLSLCLSRAAGDWYCPDCAPTAVSDGDSDEHEAPVSILKHRRRRVGANLVNEYLVEYAAEPGALARNVPYKEGVI